MCAKWNNDYDPEITLERIAKVIQVDPNGNVAYTSPSWRDYAAVLVSALHFDQRVPDVQKTAIVLRALQDAVEKGQLTAEYVRQAASRAEKAYLRKPSRDFELASSLSLRQVPPFRQLCLDGMRIVFSRSLPRRFDRSPLSRHVASVFPMHLPSDYVAIRVSTSGRSEREAADRALDSLAFLLGVWNLLLTQGSGRRTIGSSGGPIGEIRLGPVHTLHHHEGTLATNTFWYEPAYVKPAPRKDFSSKFSNLRKKEKWVRCQIRKARYAERLREAFIRYAEALHEPRLEIAFLKLWGVLEMLTNTAKAGYDTTIRRTAFLYADRKFAREELQHLRDRRNRLVHQAESSTDRETHAYQLKRFVDDMILFLLHEENIKQTIAEVAEFLDSPYEIDQLKRKIQVFTRARNFLESSDEKNGAVAK